MAIKDWSTTAGNNNSASPDGFPEGMAPSGVNNSAREVMAQVRGWYEVPEWINLGHTPTYASSSTFTIATDVTSTYTVGRAIRVVHNTGGTTSYGYITASSYSAPNTTVTVDFSLTSTVTAVSVGALHTSNSSFPQRIKYDTDYGTTFGRVSLGYSDGTDTATFSHVDNNTTTDFAVAQSAAGATKVNAKTGQTVSVNVNDSTVLSVASTGISVTGTATVSSTSTLTGAVTMSAGLTLDTAGTLECRVDTDTTHNLGRASIGNSSLADYAVFGHYDQRASSTNYGLALHSAASLSVLNAATGGTVSLRINNSQVLGATSTGVSVTGTLASSGILTCDNELICEENGASPELYLKRLDAHGSANRVGYVYFRGIDSGAAAQDYAAIAGYCSDNTAASEDGRLEFYTVNAGSSLGVRAFIEQGLVVGSPTGGDKGVGTINATAVYDDNTLLTCYVPEAVTTGDVDLNKWDNTVPNKEDDNGNTIITRHQFAREFKKRKDVCLDVDKFATFWKEKGHLPAMPSFDEWNSGGARSSGEMISRLWETVEVLAHHVDVLNQRLKKLEEKS